MTAARRASVSAVVLTVLAVGVMLLMIMFAARSGPQRIVHGTLIDPSIGAVTPSYPQRSFLGAPLLRSGNGLQHSSPVFEALATAIKIALGALVVCLLFLGLRRLREVVIVRRSRSSRPEQVEFDVLDDPESLAEEIRRDAADQLELLLFGTPRNAIVACWDRFEEQAERVQAARQPWETSSEFTLRLLDRVSADSAAVSRLESLYREARFSTHEIDESRRESAVEALHAIHLSLGAKAVPG